MTQAPVITIDGPSGAGKGTVSRALAQSLGWHYLDSGSIYRSLAIAIIDKGLNYEQVDAVVETAQSMDLQFKCGDSLSVELNGCNINDRLGLEQTGNTASLIAAIPLVRDALLQKQKAFRRLPGLVADGRDMGTVVFPDAQFKVFLTASAQIRGERRYKQLKEKGINVNLDQITREIEERDRRDQERAIAPLVMAKDALFIDSSALSIQVVLEQIKQWIQDGSNR